MLIVTLERGVVVTLKYNILLFAVSTTIIEQIDLLQYCVPIPSQMI